MTHPGGSACKASLVPAGTKFPSGWQVPRAHRIYAVLGLLDGGRLMGGGASPEAARGALTRALLRKARR